MRNQFQVDTFLDWYGQAGRALRASHRSGRFLPQHGSYLTRFSGQSLEFLDYHEYSLGDDPRLLSRRLFARTQRWFVKRMHHRSPIHVLFQLDDTESMFFEFEGRPPEEQKWARQCTIVGAFLREILNAGDTATVLGLTIRTLRDWYEVLKAFSEWTPRKQSSTPVDSSVRPRRAAMEVLLGDFLQPEDLSIVTKSSIAGPQGHTLLVLLRDPQEEDPTLEAPFRVQTVEGEPSEVFVSLFDRPAYESNRFAQEKRILAATKLRASRVRTLRNLKRDGILELLQEMIQWGER